MVWYRFGWTGVDLFFVLSGFLIGGLLFSELKRSGRLDVRRFLIRRAFKIWPAYYVFLLFMLIAVPMMEDGRAYTYAERGSALLPHFFHFQNYFSRVMLHTWSLAIEEHFYLFLPLLLFVLSLIKLETSRLFYAVAIVAALIISVCLILRLYANPTGLYQIEQRYNPTHLRADSLFFGVTLSAVYHLRPAWFSALV